MSCAWPGLSVALIVLFGAPSSVRATVDPDKLTWSSDITITVVGLTPVVEDEDALIEDDGGSPALADLGILPGSADLQGYHRFSNNGHQLFSLDTAAVLSGTTVEPRDVVRYDGSSYTIEFKGSNNLIPAGARVDAVSRVSGDLLLSFDVTVTVLGVTADDEDLVRVTGPGSVSLFFDASAAAGVGAESLDLDAAHVRGVDGPFLLSFDGSGSFDGVDFDDEDVLAYDPVGDTWELAFDGSLQHAALPEADLVALHEVKSTWQFQGVAQGGMITFDVDGVALQVTTVAGQSSSTVAAAIAAEINGNATLLALGVTATAAGNQVVTNGVVTNTVITDPGLTHGFPVPTLGPWGIALAVALLLVAGAARARRRSLEPSGRA